ncbi:MAG: hypothetical protein H6R13_2726 [Proteobacteria bacterium]|nr:hypothetical protein [Pseudomonadota bacterium]
MTIFFNALGLAWLIAGLGGAIGLQTAGILVLPSGQFFGTVACTVIFGLDMAYRFFVAKARLAKAADPSTAPNDVRSHWLVSPGAGGSLMFIPAWASAFVALVLGYVLG